MVKGRFFISDNFVDSPTITLFIRYSRRKTSFQQLPVARFQQTAHAQMCCRVTAAALRIRILLESGNWQLLEGTRIARSQRAIVFVSKTFQRLNSVHIKYGWRFKDRKLADCVIYQLYFFCVTASWWPIRLRLTCRVDLVSVLKLVACLCAPFQY